MNSTISHRIAKGLEDLHRLYPDWRFGQMVANVAAWAKGPASEAVWDVEDEEFLSALEAHLRTRNTSVAESR